MATSMHNVIRMKRGFCRPFSRSFKAAMSQASKLSFGIESAISNAREVDE